MKAIGERNLGSQDRVAAQIGINGTTFRKAMKPGRFKRSNETTQKGIAAITGIPLSELLRLAALDAGEEATPIEYQKAMPPDVIHKSMVPVPMINMTSAGLGATSTDLGYASGVADKYILLAPHQSGDPNMFAVQVTGDSCQPYLFDGDYVVASPAADFVNGALHVVQMKSGGEDLNTLKCVRLVDEENVDLVSPNAVKYLPRRIPRADVVRMALVVYLIRSMDVVFKDLF